VIHDSENTNLKNTLHVTCHDTEKVLSCWKQILGIQCKILFVVLPLFFMEIVGNSFIKHEEFLGVFAGHLISFNIP
jgi:hypothetical protein